ncbi:MAG: heme exporter protein CcmD [Ilumatobacteraceae bacterium]|jgi:heme exporter protein D|nr:heme exporter protein CcmD [Ilumatobacteraceae bacterium]
MIWNSWTEFWAMGGYGLYVWGSFGVTALCVALEMIWVKNARAQALTQISNELVAETNSKEWS